MGQAEGYADHPEKTKICDDDPRLEVTLKQMNIIVSLYLNSTGLIQDGSQPTRDSVTKL